MLFRLFPQMMLRLTIGQFHPIHNFSHLLPLKHLIFREISNIFIFFWGGVHQQIFYVFELGIISHQRGSKLPTVANFLQKSGLDWLKWPMLVILHVSPSFPQNDAQIDSE